MRLREYPEQIENCTPQMILPRAKHPDFHTWACERTLRAKKVDGGSGQGRELNGPTAVQSSLLEPDGRLSRIRLSRSVRLKHSRNSPIS